MAKCKKCLLLEAGERVTYSEIMDYVATLDKHDLADESLLKAHFILQRVRKFAVGYVFEMRLLC